MTSESEILSEIMGSNPELEAEIAAYDGKEAEAEEVAKIEAELLDAPAPAVEAETAPVAEEKATEPAKAAENVPLPVFLDVKSDLKEARAELRAMREQLEALKAPKEEPKADTKPAFTPTVRYEDDPAQFLKEKIDHQEKVIEWQERNLASVGQATRQTAEQTHQAQQMQAFSRAVSTAEDSYRAVQPDYDAAVEHMRTTRVNAAKAYVESMGGTWDGQTHAQASQMVVNEFAQIAADAFRRGLSPAEALYKLASLSGYQPASKASETRLATIEKGMAASKTVSNLNGGRVQEQTSGGDWIKGLQKEAGYA